MFSLFATVKLCLSSGAETTAFTLKWVYHECKLTLYDDLAEEKEKLNTGWPNLLKTDSNTHYSVNCWLVMLGFVVQKQLWLCCARDMVKKKILW